LGARFKSFYEGIEVSVMKQNQKVIVKKGGGFDQSLPKNPSEILQPPDKLLIHRRLAHLV